MANGRIKIANNIEQVAQDIISYIFPYLKTSAEKKRHRNQLSAIFQEVLEEYKKPLIDMPVLAYIEKHYINPYFRQRPLEIEATGRLIKESEDDERHIILQAITLFLEEGKCESTSANTIVLDLLIKQLNKYEPINEDERFSNNSWKGYGSRLGIRETLRDAFVNKAKVILENWQMEKKSPPKVLVSEPVSKERKSLNIDAAFLEQLSLFRTGRSLATSPQVKMKHEMEAGTKLFKRVEIVNPEQTTWVDNKRIIGHIADYQPQKLKEERKINKLDFSTGKLAEVAAKLNSINQKKAQQEDPILPLSKLKPEEPIKKIGKIKDRAEFQETIKLLEEHTQARLAK